MGGRSSRTKGHAFERYIAQRLRPYGEARRNVAETQVASVDIITDLPFGIQCKRLKQWVNPQAIYGQAVSGTKQDGIIPMGIVKIDFEHRIVCFMTLSHFKILFEDMIKAKKFIFQKRLRTKARKFKILDGKKKFIRNPKLKTTPYTLLNECFERCLPDQEPIALWKCIYKIEKYKRLKTVLACFDFELFLKQVEKVYGKKEDSSNNLQRESRPCVSESASPIPSS